MVRIKDLLIAIGLLNLFAGYLLMVWTFYDAFVTPNKRVMVYINTLGEANAEAYILLTLTPLSLYAFIYFFQLIVKDKIPK